MGNTKRRISKRYLWGWNILIFVTTGSRKFQFDRLIKKLDELIEERKLTEEIFAQIAETQYIPKNFRYKRYLNPDEFKQKQHNASLIISHAGTGALISALKMNKQVIAVPRYARFNEHSDDHQIQISEMLEKEGYLRVVYDIGDLGDVIKEAYEHPIVKQYDKPSNVIPLIIQQIQDWNL